MSHRNPLAEGLRRTARPEAPTVETLARAYGVADRTIYRWQRAGVDVNDPVAVADHLLRQKNPSLSAVKRAVEFVTNEPTNQ